MGLELQHKIKLQQQLLITPQLQQAIKILQLSTQELEAFIDDQLTSNPILEEAEENNPEDLQNEDERADYIAQKKEEETPFDTREVQEFQENETESRFLSETSYSQVNYEEILSREATLHETLKEQLSLSPIKPQDQELALLLIDFIDEAGYLKADMNYLQKKGYSLKRVERVITLIQELEPPGIGARTVKESLLIQAQKIQDKAPLLKRIIHNHLDDLARRNYKPISQALKISLEQTKDLARTILTFSARPGYIHSSVSSSYIAPDLYIQKTACGWSVSLEKLKNENLGLNSSYLELSKHTKRKEDRDFLKTKIQEARWLIKSLEQRKKTLRKVMEAIFLKQKEFFLYGKEHLKPLILKDIASETNLHESTISRITTNKYVHTPYGLFELRAFFNSQLSTSEGGKISSSVAKHYIRNLIKAEDEKKPLSDRKLQEKLREKGIDIARRTVTKYREQLGFLSSNHRIRYH